MRVQTAAVTLVGATLGQPEDCSAVIGCHMHQLNYQTVVEKERVRRKMSLLKKEIKTKQNPSDLHFAGRHPFLFVFTSLYLIEL